MCNKTTPGLCRINNSATDLSWWEIEDNNELEINPDVFIQQPSFFRFSNFKYFIYLIPFVTSWLYLWDYVLDNSWQQIFVNENIFIASEENISAAFL